MEVTVCVCLFLLWKVYSFIMKIEYVHTSLKYKLRSIKCHSRVRNSVQLQFREQGDCVSWEAKILSRQWRSEQMQRPVLRSLHHCGELTGLLGLSFLISKMFRNSIRCDKDWCANMCLDYNLHPINGSPSPSLACRIRICLIKESPFDMNLNNNYDSTKHAELTIVEVMWALIKVIHYSRTSYSCQN